MINARQITALFTSHLAVPDLPFLTESYRIIVLHITGIDYTWPYVLMKPNQNIHAIVQQ
jgi:hypothetical protein